MNARPWPVFPLVLWAAVVSACGEQAASPPSNEAELVEVVSVGVLEGDEREVFGDIVEVGAAQEGSFLVLDRLGASLGWFDLEGRYRGGIRSQGSGPGELLQPTALGVSASGRVVILDPPNGRYAFYEMSERGVEYRASTRQLPTARGSICAIGDRFFLRTVHDGYLIHEFDQDGQVLQSFGAVQPVDEERFGPAAGMVASQLNTGHLSCITEASLLVSLDTYLPYVRAYSLDGALVWETALQDLRPIEFRPLPEGGVRFEADPEEGAHMGRSILRWTAGSLVAQHTVTWPERIPVEDRDREHFRVESRELSIETGQELGWAAGVPLLLDEQEGRFYGYRSLPFPTARVFERTR